MTLGAARLTSNELANPRTLISEELFDRLTARVAVAENLPAISAERVIEQTLAFLVACALNPDKALSPSAPVDPGWHAFLTYTRAYADFCRRVAGRFIHHTPTDTPGVAARLHIEDGNRVFLKAIPADSTAAHLYRRERWAASVLPSAAPTPRMLWSSAAGGWITLVFEHLDGRGADLSPASPDVPAVLDTVTRLGALLTPCSAAGAPPVAGNVGFLVTKSRHLLGKPDGTLPHRDLYAAAFDRFDVEDLVGATLLHYDPHPGNLWITDEGVRVIDWGFAAVGAAWIDAFMLGPRLIEAGHTPEQAETLLARVPAWRDAPPRAVNGLLAAWTLFRVHKAVYGPEESREFRSHAAGAGRAWLTHRVGGA